ITATYFFPGLPPYLGIFTTTLAAAAAGGLWGAIAGLLKARRGSHEVIVTILLNFIAAAIVDYCVLYVFKDPAIQSPETFSVPEGYHVAPLDQCFHWAIGPFFRSTPANAVLGLAIVAAIVTYYFLFRTTYGYELRAVGKNPHASQFAAISVSRSL